MQQMAISEFRSAGWIRIKSLLPVEILVDGKVEAILSRDEDVIVISDLHPRMRNMLKAMEKKARFGMPRPEKVDTAAIKAIEV